MELLGPPPPDLLLQATRKRLFFDSKGSPRSVTNSKGRKRRPSTRSLAAAVRSDDPAFMHFLHRCLEWDPKRRITPTEATRHEFITGCPLGSTTSMVGSIARAAPAPGVRAGARGALLHSQSAGDVAAMLGRA
ncbi:unnamed protein product [Plutella xylostella]|uniref:(diamondback moth) hypothetical protein n=1 Tax=Plutella xylostella TaxID=51655 RepID=A0A8S4EZN7_PLUXY|nr:unnamed protein product [Plutella xylostella]